MWEKEDSAEGYHYNTSPGGVLYLVSGLCTHHLSFFVDTLPEIDVTSTFVVNLLLKLL